MLFGKTQNKSLLQNLLAICVLVIISIYTLFPIIKNLGTVSVGQGDVLLITWIINQNIQKIPKNLLQIFEGNIFYPFKHVIAYSELFIPSSLTSYIPFKLFNLPTVAFNSSLIFSQIVTLLVIYFWFLEMTRDKIASLTAVIAFGLSQIRMIFYPYLQMFAMEYFLLSSWMVWKYKTYEKPKYLIFASLFAAIQIWESLLPVYFILFLAVILISPKYKIVVRDVKYVVLSALIFLILTFPVLWVYFNVSHDFVITRSLREAAHFSMNLNDIWGKLFSPGFFAIFLASIFIINKKTLKKSKDLFWLIVLTIFGFVMALGPVLKIDDMTFKIFKSIFVPLPYGVFYYVIPGFTALRTPLRWIWLCAFGISGIIALVLSKYKGKYKNFICIACIGVSIVGGFRIKNVINVPKKSEYPLVYHYVKNLPQKVIIEMPMYSWGIGEPFQHEFWRMFYSLDHGKKMVNGASGLNPPEWENLQSFLWENFPSKEVDEKLKEIGINYIVVHKDEYQNDYLLRIEAWGKNRLLWEDKVSAVYKVI